LPRRLVRHRPGDPGYSKLTSKALTATAIYYCDVTILQKVATLLNKMDDAARWTAYARRISAAFNAKLFDPKTNQYDRGSQCANAMPSRSI